MTSGGFRGRNHLGEGVLEDLLWTLSLRSRMTGFAQGNNKARLQAGGGVPLIGQNNILRIYYGFLTHNLRMNAAIHGQAENDIREKMLFYTP